MALDFEQFMWPKEVITGASENVTIPPNFGGGGTQQSWKSNPYWGELYVKGIDNSLSIVQTKVAVSNSTFPQIAASSWLVA